MKKILWKIWRRICSAASKLFGNEIVRRRNGPRRNWRRRKWQRRNCSAKKSRSPSVDRALSVPG